MACAIDSGRLDFSCKTSRGGLKALYILSAYNADLKNQITLTSGEITAVASAQDVFKFELVDDANTFTEANEVSRANGTSVYAPAGTFVLKRQDLASQETLTNLSNMRAQVIIEDHNGSFRLVGLENGVDFTVGTQTGGAWSDLNGYNLAFKGKEPALATYIDPSIIGVAGSGFDVSTVNVDPN
jgi:hypothetical protein